MAIKYCQTANDWAKGDGVGPLELQGLRQGKEGTDRHNPGETDVTDLELWRGDHPKCRIKGKVHHPTPQALPRSILGKDQWFSQKITEQPS